MEGGKLAQLFFTYGAMNAGKSIELLKVAHNYDEQGKEVYILTSSVDTRSGIGKVASRIGIEKEADVIFEESNIFDMVVDKVKELAEYDDEILYAVLIDEAQFLSRDQIIQLTKVVDNLGIPVLTYGLKNDFSNHLFEGSQALIEFADKLKEMKTVCQYCDKKAGFNLRVIEGQPIYEGDQIQVGGNESYVSVCRKCYYNPPIRRK